MHDPKIVPGLFSFARLTALLFSVLVAISSGSNYVVGAYLPQLGARLHLTHTILNVYAVAGNIGVYMSGPFWGKIADTRGPRLLLIVGFISLLSGYSGIRGIFDAGLGNATELSRSRLVVLILCSFITGVGGNSSMTAAMNTTARNFPDHLRAMTVGFVMSGFGLSAFFFSSISHTLFPGNTSDFLLVLGIGTAIPVIAGLFFVRLIPLPSSEETPLEVASPNSYQPLATSADPDEFQHHDSGSISPQFQSEEDEERESGEPKLKRDDVPRRYSSASHVPLPDLVELSRTTTYQSFNRPRSTSDPTQPPPSEAIIEGRGADLYRWTLLQSVDFWILCTMHTLLAGTGLMYINNVGSMAQTLFAHDNPAYDEAESSAWQAAQVSALSLANFFGRVVIGIVADTAKSRFRVPRSFCLPLVTTLFILSQLSLIVIGDVRHLWMASVLVGLGYGCWFGLLPTISIEWFGLAHFSENWGIISVFPVLGGNIFSIAFGRNLDAHAPPAESSPNVLPTSSERQCLAGRECYVQTLHLNLWACVIVLCLAIWAGRRDWVDWQERGHQEKPIEWEDARELVGSGSVDLDP